MIRAILIGALLVSGCRIFDESLLGQDGGPIDAGGRDAGDAGPDSATDGGHDGGPACALHRPPPRPSTEDGAPVAEVVFALRDFRLDQGDDWSTIGYDLDGLCSIAPSPVVECLPPAASGAAELDGAGGIDNAFGHQIAPLILTVMPDLGEHLHDEHAKGAGNFVVTLRGWNGERDDPRVEAIVSQAVFAAPALPDGGRPDVEIPDAGFSKADGGVPPPEPVWDGRDWFWVRAETYAGGDPSRPLLRDDNAYVAGGELVIRLAERVPLVFASSTAERGTIMRLTDAMLVLELSEDGTSVPRATLAGRWPVSDLLGDIVHSGVCPGTTDYRSFERLLDLGADVRTVPESGGAGATCDAVSIGVTYTGRRAHIAEVTDRFGFPSPCDLDAGP